MAEEGKKPLDFVEETVLKKRKDNEEWAVKRRERLQLKRQKKEENARFSIKRPEEFVQEYRDKELDMIRMKHRLRQHRLSQSKIGSKLLFVIRIHGSQGMHGNTRKILNRLRLRNIFDGVFIKSNESILRMLLGVEPYVTYGYPNLESVRRLVYKKGCGKKAKERIPLTNNTVVEEELGKYGIICLEDIVHEIANVGSYFKEVSSFLWPFKLKRPDERVHLKKKAFKHGGDTGYRGDKINDFINKLN